MAQRPSSILLNSANVRRLYFRFGLFQSRRGRRREGGSTAKYSGKYICNILKTKSLN